MSYGLLRVDCQICQSEVRIDDGAPWTDKAVLVPTYQPPRMVQIADATCTRCGARYSAWRGSFYGDIPVGRDFSDLSFRSTFSTTPSSSDLPSPATLQQLHEESWFQSASELRAKAAALIQQAIEAEDRAVTGKSEWEDYRIDPVVVAGKGGVGGAGGFVDTMENGAPVYLEPTAGSAGADGLVVISWLEDVGE